MTFFKELNRRNVFRVGIAYLITAWLLLQVADVVLGNIDAPDWVFQVILLLLAIGLPLALIFSWAFELTPEGVKREKDVDRSQSITHFTGRKLDRAIIVALVLAVAYFVWESRFSVPQEQSDTPLVLEQTVTTQDSAEIEPSIAVLPFVDLSPEGDQAYFSDGISEELLNLLVRVEGLKVASRTSSFAYRGGKQSISEIAGDLNVNHVLEGSVRKSDNRVRITAQLIDAATDRHLWSDTFDRELVDIFSIQEDIGNAIVTALTNELNIADPLEGITVLPVTANLDAYELYLEARQLFVGRRHLDQAIRLFGRAVDLDPDFALAWEGLAATEAVSIGWLRNDGVDHVSRARAAANKALELNPDLSMPYAVLGNEDLNVDTDTGRIDMLQVIKHKSTALEKDPKNATAWLWRGLSMQALGFFDEAITDFSHCLDLDPSYLHCKIFLGAAEIDRGNDARGLELYRECLDSNFKGNIYSFVPALLRSGNRTATWFALEIALNNSGGPVTELISALENPERDHSAIVVKLRRWSLSHGVEPDRNHAIWIALLGGYDTLDHDVFNGFYPNANSFWEPSLAPFRDTPGFKFIARMNGLPEYWRAKGFPPVCRPNGDDDFECD